MEEKPKFTRVKNPIEAFLGIKNKRELNEDERAMQTLLSEEYKKSQKNLLVKIRRWREEHREATMGDAIRALYEELDKKE